MKKFIITTTIALTAICFNNLCAQNFIYVGNDKYEATEDWNFSVNARSVYGTSINLKIAKDQSKGLLMLKYPTLSSSYYLKGDVSLFLDNGDVIKCIDRGIKDYFDNFSIAVYKLTKEEIISLKGADIRKIRFSILGSLGKLNSYTADNVIKSYRPSNNSKYKTSLDVTNLFDYTKY